MVLSMELSTRWEDMVLGTRASGNVVVGTKTFGIQDTVLESRTSGGRMFGTYNSKRKSVPKF